MKRADELIEQETNELGRLLGDKMWRLCNLYSIKCAETGRVIPFRPRPEQVEVFQALIDGHTRIVILKARRLGMSTALDIYAADDMIWNAGIQISIVDRKLEDATKKLINIVKVAFFSMPEEILGRFVVSRNNDSSFEVSIQGDETSAIYAGTNARGGTNQLLHVSEWGVIQAEDVKRSEEILTGALPSAEHGVIVIETTWMGGRKGHLWDIIEAASRIPEDQRELKDWKVFFFPWWNDPTYRGKGRLENIEPEVLKYLAEKEAELEIVLSDDQKVWYAREKAKLGAFMFREFPSSVDECFKSPVDGAIYASYLDALRSKGGIVPFPIDGSALVHTFWDLGAPAQMVVWYIQIVGREFRVIDVDYSTKERVLDFTPVERAAHMLAKGYPYGCHYMPHDAMQTERSGKTFLSEMTAAGLENCRVVPRTSDIWIGIGRLRQLIPRMVFRLPICEAALEALNNYHTKVDSVRVQEVPVHDWSSHAADALRTFSEAEMAGMVSAVGVGHGRVKVKMGPSAPAKAKSRVDQILDPWFGSGPEVRVKKT